jgi:hypothetical protein
MKRVYEQYFVENQKMKASAQFLETVEGCWKKTLNDDVFCTHPRTREYAKTNIKNKSTE